MNLIESGPVTFGQLSFLRSIEPIPMERHAEANQLVVLPLPANVGATAAVDAWNQLVLRNETLRTTYEIGSRDPVQHVHVHRAAQVSTLKLEAATFEAALEAVRPFLAEPISIWAGSPWRAFLGAVDGVYRYLIAIVHHCAADHTACLLLEEQFRQLLTGTELPPPARPLDLARRQRAAQARNLDVINYWAHAWGGMVDEDRRGPDPTRRTQAAISSRSAMSAVRRIAERLNVSAASVVLAATYLALFEVKQRSAVTLALMSSNRFDRRWESMVSCMNQIAPLTVHRDPNMATADFVRAVASSSTEAYMRGSYSVDALRDHLTELGVPNPDPITFDCFFNFVGTGEAIPPDDSVLATSVEWQPAARETGPRLNIRVGTGEALAVSVRASQDYLAPDLVGQLAVSIEAALISLADEQLTTAKMLSFAALRDVPPRP
ncbi:condensation domain-containing protein [Micromonospora sp. NPDC049051]|uniref:condensation domain-containing protein n=1 Tax=Micromonospora sp. NPDC049051 TaxID=3364264 RepID=UPI00371D311C